MSYFPLVCVFRSSILHLILGHSVQDRWWTTGGSPGEATEMVVAGELDPWGWFGAAGLVQPGAEVALGDLTATSSAYGEVITLKSPALPPRWPPYGHWRLPKVLFLSEHYDLRTFSFYMELLNSTRFGRHLVSYVIENPGKHHLEVILQLHKQ